MQQSNIISEQQVFYADLQQYYDRIFVIKFYYEQPPEFRATDKFKRKLLAGQTAEANYAASRLALGSDEGVKKRRLTAKFLDDMHQECMGQPGTALQKRLVLHYEYIGDLI